MPKVTKAVKVTNELGLHLRPVGKLVNLANRFVSEIILEKDGIKANGKSILSVMSLGAEPGSTIIITADGEDAELAVAALETFILNIDKLG